MPVERTAVLVNLCFWPSDGMASSCVLAIDIYDLLKTIVCIREQRFFLCERLKALVCNRFRGFFP